MTEPGKETMPDVAKPLLFGACYVSFRDHEQGTYCIMDTMGQSCKSQAQILSAGTYRPAGSNSHYGALSLYGAHFTTPPPPIRPGLVPSSHLTVDTEKLV